MNGRAFDLVIRGGRVVDGTGRPPFPADVAVRDGRIVAVEALPDAVDTIDVVAAEGLLVAPGFVDIHTHSDLTVIADPAAESKLLQGVTTDVTGNCGFSPFPTADAHRHDHTELMAMLGPTPPVAGWPDLDAYASALRAEPPAINIAPLVGHGALRVDVVGTRAGPLSDDELATIVARLETALEQGAFGLSTGLTYVPVDVRHRRRAGSDRRGARPPRPSVRHPRPLHRRLRDGADGGADRPEPGDRGPRPALAHRPHRAVDVGSGGRRLRPLRRRRHRRARRRLRSLPVRRVLVEPHPVPAGVGRARRGRRNAPSSDRPRRPRPGRRRRGGRVVRRHPVGLGGRVGEPRSRCRRWWAARSPRSPATAAPSPPR